MFALARCAPMAAPLLSIIALIVGSPAIVVFLAKVLFHEKSAIR